MSVEDAGTIESELRLKLTQMEKDALEAQRKMDALAAKFKKQGASAGDGFANGMKQGFDRTEVYAAKMGRTIATKLSPAIIGITVGIKAIQGLGKAIGDAFMANEKFAKGMSDLKSSLGASFTAAAKPVSDWFANLIDKAARSVRQTNEVKAALKRLTEENQGINFDDALAVKLEKATANFVAAQKKLKDAQKDVEMSEAWMASLGRGGQRLYESTLQKKRDLLLQAEKDLEEATRSHEEILLQTGNASIISVGKLQEVEDEYLKTLDIINFQKEKGAITQRERDEAEISALNNYINKTAEILKMADEQEIKESEYNRNFETRIAERIALQEKLKKADEEKITEARIAAMEKYEQAERRAHDAKAAGLIGEQEMERQIHAAMAQQYSDLEAIVVQYGLVAEGANEAGNEVMRLRDGTAERVKKELEGAKAKENQAKIGTLLIDQSDELLQQEIETWKAKAAASKSEAARNAALDEAIRLENQLIDRQQYRAWQEIENSEAYIAASDKEKEAVLQNFEEITAGMKKVREDAKKDGGFLKNVFSSEGYSRMLQLGNATVDAYDTVSNTILEINRRHAEEEIALIEKVLESKLESIEKAREAELIANGFAVSNNSESLEAKLVAAKQTGDEILIYLAARRLKEQQINDEYDKKAEEAEEEARKKKAEIEHKIAVQEYSNQMINAVNAGIMAVLQALAAAPPPYNFILAGLSGTATGVQIGLLAKNPPQPPKFANSGIVPGNNYFGDRNIAAVDSGELILNRAHQDNIATQLTSNSSPVNATIVVMMDTREIAKSTVDLVNDGFYTIKVRALR